VRVFISLSSKNRFKKIKNLYLEFKNYLFYLRGGKFKMHFIIKALFLISLIFSFSYGGKPTPAPTASGFTPSTTAVKHNCSELSNKYSNKVWFMEAININGGTYIELEIKDNIDTSQVSKWSAKSCVKVGKSKIDCSVMQSGVNISNGKWIVFDNRGQNEIKINQSQLSDLIAYDEDGKIIDYLVINEDQDKDGTGRYQFDDNTPSCFNHSITGKAPNSQIKGIFRGEGTPIVTEEGGSSSITPSDSDGWIEIKGGNGNNGVTTKGNSNACNWCTDKSLVPSCQAGTLTCPATGSSFTTTYDSGCKDINSLSPYLLFDDNISGGLKFIGDSVLKIDSGSSDKNNDTNMVAKTTSQATLSLESGESIKKAYLIWQGYLEGNQSSNYTDSTYYKNTNTLVNSIDNITLNGKNLTAQTTDIHYKHCYHRFDYQAMIDITDEISDKTVSQNFTVSNLNTQSGNVLGGAYGVWAIAFVYENPSQIYKNVTLFHMYDEIYSENSKDITFNGFHTPNATPFEADLFIVAGEGDEGYTGDNVKINNNLLVSNAFNSSIYTDSNNRSPEALDIDDYNGTNGIDSKIGANETSSTFTLETNGDRYFPAIVGLATELFVPKLCYSEEVFKDGLKLGSNDVVYLGDELTFNVTVGNIGKDVAESVSVKKPFYTPFEYAQNTSYITGVKKLDSSSEVTYLNPDLSLKLPDINNSSNTNFSYNANIIAYPKDGIIDNNYTATYNGGQYIEINSEKIPQCSNSNIYPQIYVALLDVKYSISSNDDLSDTNKTEVATNNNIIFDINITNLGEVNATETNITIDLPSGFEFISDDNPNLTCVDPIQNNQLVCNFNNSYKIYPNQEESIKITLKAPNYEIDFNTSVGGSTLPEGKTRQDIETKESEVEVIKPSFKFYPDIPTNLSINEAFNYNLTIENNGSLEITNLEVNITIDKSFLDSNISDGDSIPSLGSDWSCTYKNTNIINCLDGNLSIDQNRTLSIPMKASSTPNTYLTEDNIIGSSITNTYSQNIEVVPPTLKLHPSIPTTLKTNEAFDYNLTIENNSSGEVTNLEVNITIDKSFLDSNIADGDSITSIGNDWSCTYRDTDNIYCIDGNLSVDQNKTISIPMRASSTPNIYLTEDNVTADYLTDSYSQNINVEASDTNLTVSSDLANPTSLSYNQNFDYNVTITNRDNITAIDVEFNLSIDNLDNFLDSSKFTNSSEYEIGDSKWECTKSSNILNCKDGNLSANSDINISLPFISPSSSGEFNTTLRAKATNSDIAYEINKTIVVNSEPDITVSKFSVTATHNTIDKTVSSGSVVSDFNSEIKLVFKVANVDATATDVNLTIPLSSDFSDTTAINFSVVQNGGLNTGVNGRATSFATSDCQIIQTELICSIGDLPAGFSGDFEFTFDTPSTFSGFDVKVKAYGSNSDSNPSDNETSSIRVQNLFANSSFNNGAINEIDYIIQGDFVVLDENNKIASLPTGATIKEAKLYWQGSIPNADKNSSSKSVTPEFGKITLNTHNIELNVSDNNLSWIKVDNGFANSYDLIYQGIYDIKADDINNLKIGSTNTITAPDSLANYQNFSIIVIYEDSSSDIIKSVNLRESFIGIDSNTTLDGVDSQLDYQTISFQGFMADIVDVNDSKFYNISTKDSDFNISINVAGGVKEDSFNTIFDISEDSQTYSYVNADDPSFDLRLNNITDKRYYSGATIVSTKLKNPICFYAVAKDNSQNKGNNQKVNVFKNDKIDVKFYLDSENVSTSISDSSFTNVDVRVDVSNSTYLEIKKINPANLGTTYTSYLEANLSDITSAPDFKYTLNIKESFSGELNVSNSNVYTSFDLVGYRINGIRASECQNDVLAYADINPIFDIWEETKHTSWQNGSTNDKNISTLTTGSSSSNFVVSTDDSTIFDNNRTYKVTIDIIDKLDGDSNLSTISQLNGADILLNKDITNLTLPLNSFSPTITTAHRYLKFNINWNLLDENNNTINDPSANGSGENSDGFAIRPSHFFIDLPDTVLAGNIVPIDLEAQNSSNNPISNYDVNASVYHLKEDILTTGATIVFDYDKTQSFSTGAISNLDSNFTDVGEVNVTINDGWENYQSLTCNTPTCYDNDGCPFACIDFLSDYSNADTILITSAEDNTTIYPYEFNISTGFSDYFSNNGNPWTYMADMIDLNVTFDFNITAKNRQGDTTRNFDNTSPIFYEAVNFTLNFTQINVNSDFEYSLNEGVINTNGAFSSIFSSNFNFSAGESNSSLVFNLKRDRTTAISPANLKFNSISPNLSANMRSAGVNNNSDSAIKAENNVSFYYGRVDGKDIEIDVHTILNPNALVFAEIYLDDKDRDFANIFDSVDIDDYENPNSESFWYQNLAHDISINTPIKSLNWSDDKINLDGSGAGTGISNLNLIDGLSKLPITNTLNSDEFARGVTIYLDVDKYLWFDKYSPYGYSNSNNKNTQPSFDIILRNSNTNRGPGVNQEVKSDVINKRRIDW